MNRPFALFVVVSLSGCVAPLKMDYLNPQGIGSVRTVGNPCPYAYRAMEVRGTKDPEVRVTVGAFSKGEYRLTKTTLFLVVSDVQVSGSQVAQFHSPPMNREHKISFPNGTNVKTILPGGVIVAGQFVVENRGEPTRNAAILSFPIVDRVLNEFTAFLPSIIVDGEAFELGEVSFKRASETWYVLNC